MHIVIDLDETLIGNWPADSWALPMVDVSQDTGWPDAVVLRPHARHFLHACRESFSSLNLATWSRRRRALRVLEALGIREYFHEVYACEDIKPGLYPEDDSGRRPSPQWDGDFLLLDDQPRDSQVIESKMDFFLIDPWDDAAVQARHIQVAPFAGRAEDQELLWVWRELMKFSEAIGERRLPCLHLQD